MNALTYVSRFRTLAMSRVGEAMHLATLVYVNAGSTLLAALLALVLAKLLVLVTVRKSPIELMPTMADDSRAARLAEGRER